MRIGILSDTHDRRVRTALAVRKLADLGAEALIHCGDLTTADMVYECAPLPTHFVFGNNDDDEVGIRQAIQEIEGVCLDWAGEIMLGGRRIAITHGHLSREVRRLAASGPDYLCFGHSHVATDRREGLTRWINPGALHRAEIWTVALLDLERDELRSLVVA